MNQAINMCITGLNNIGQGFWNYAAGIFIQSSVLIVLLLIIDFLLRKRVRAVFRYCLWMLVFIKLVMPASFTLPTGIGYWMGDYFPSEVSMAKWIPQTEEIVPTTLKIHQRSIPLEPVVTNETAVNDIYQGLIPLEPVVTNETAVIDIHQRSIPLEPVVTNETAVIDIYQDLIPLEPVVTNERAVTGIELEPICWQGLVFLGWLVGMLALLVLLVQRICFVRGLIAQSRPANGRLLEMLDECRCLIGIRQNIELRLTGNRLSPADCGLFKPIILMPATLPEKLSREKLKAVLIHELAHIKRGDVWVNLVQTVLQIIYFYNPFVWLANAMVRRVREQAVDEMVLVTLKPETKSYSNTLIDIAEMAFWRPNFSLRLIGVVESKKALERRIKHMLNRPVPKSSKLGYPGLIAIVLIGAILLPMGSNSIAEAANTQKQSRVLSESNTIVPGMGVGDYTLGMSKDEVLRKLGEPELIFEGGERYTLNNLPRRYYMVFDDVSFRIVDDSVKGITVLSPFYKFTNGLGVGDSEQTIKQAFGDDFHFEKGRGKDFLTYEGKGLQFEIHKKKRTVMELSIYQTKRDQGDSMKALTPSPLEPFDNVGGKDLRTCDLRNEGPVLDTLEFNQETRWPTPDRLPEGFDPKALLQEGMNPGLGVRALHAEGITGAGVHVGLIDQPLLLDHPEYAGKIVSYHDAGCGPSMSSMHGPGMASQLVGSRCGTAPGAKLHVVAVPSWKGDAEYYARALDRLVTRNREVRKDQKIRVVSVSAQPSGEGSDYANQSLWDRAVQRAQANGILVLDCTWHHGFVSLCWLDPQDRESVEACTPGFRNGNVEFDKGHIHVPSAPRTVAEASAERPYGYAYDGGGRRSSRAMAKNGYSDTIPYTAGILAMGWQIRPDLTPAQMKEMLFASAYVHKSGARIINPKPFINLVQKQSDNQQTRTRPQTYSETQTIVPGVRVGDYTLDMSKDDVLRKLGEPEAIQLGEDEVDVVRRGEERYSLNNLPSHYIMSFGDISFWFSDDSVEAISVRSPLYKLSNGLGVGDSEQKIKQAFGEGFHLEEVLGKDFLCYLAKGLGFEIHKKNQTVAEIVVYEPEGDRDAPDQQAHSKHTIVPGVGVGNYMLGMSKQVLNKSGEPEGMYFVMDDGVVKEISVHSPLYKFANGLGVGDSEENIKQAFGNDFQLEEFELKALLTYEDKGLQFEIHKKNRTVREITVVRSHGDSDTPDSRKVIMLSEQSPGPITFPKIDRRPKPEMDEPRGMNTLPKYNPDSTNPFQMDLRCRDLSKLDLTNSIDDLLYATFDDRTVWPASDKMPHDFTWQKIMELGKNPGLGIRSLHKKGITGHGVSIAILDQPLLVDHQEYAERLRLYEEIHIQSGTEPQMHGPAVASIAVGKTVGVAPEAELYYIAQWNFDWEKEHAPTLRYLAQGIHRILEVNEQLPKDKKIRVISISKGWTRSHKEYRLITEAAQKARAAGMLVVCTSIELVHDGFDFGGLGRSPLADPDVFESYNAGLFMDRAFRGNVFSFPEGNIWVPMDSRTTASPTGCDEYVFYRQGGFSWAVPYIAGVYALAAQVEPDITPERFWALAMKTGRTIELEHKGERRSFGPIIDAVRLIGSIKAGDLSNLNQKQSDNQRIRTRPQTYSKTQTIVPGVRVGDYTFGMSKDEVLRKLGEPESIFGGGGRYTLNNLPRRYFMIFDDISFEIDNDSVKGIGVHSPLYKFTNGLGVGDSEQKIKQAFGYDFNLKEFDRKDFLNYEDKGLQFEIRKKDRTVMEIGIYQSEGNRGDRDAPDQEEHSKHTIVPGVRVGDYTFDMSKDEVLRKLGEPESIQFEEDEVVHRGEEKYSLNNLPSDCILAFGDVSFWIKDDSVKVISVRSPLYKLSNGLGVGDSEQKIKQAFGEDFQSRKEEGKDYLCYDAKWLAFEIHKKNQTVAEIVTYQPKVDRPDSAQVALVRKAAAEGRILYKVTTPEEFKEIAGEPTREWTDGDDVIYMEYPGIEVKFVGKPESNTPHTIIYVLCERRGIDIGQDRPMDEGDLDQQPDRSLRKDLSNLVRQAAAQGRISFKLTTPEEFKEIAGQPTREEVGNRPGTRVNLFYPGFITASFFGWPDETRTLGGVWCESRQIDIGQNRPVVLRDEGDLSRFGKYNNICGADLSRLDLSQKGDLLERMTFDSLTVWPEPGRLPRGFEPGRRIEEGKTPGLGVRSLHQEGINGNGVGIAIVDGILRRDHIEYADRIKSYHVREAEGGSHAPPVCSIAVGKTCGVAPGASLHFYGVLTGDNRRYARAVEQIVGRNRNLPPSEKVRVISISIGVSQKDHYDQWRAAADKAEKAGILVVTCDKQDFMPYSSIKRIVGKDPDDPNNYGPSYLSGLSGDGNALVYVPIENRSMASHRGKDVYTFDTYGGNSWAAPYLAGLAALAFQVHPGISPDRIVELWKETATRTKLGPVINPRGFIEAVKRL